MVTNWMTGLDSDLRTLDTLVNSLKQHEETDMPLDEKQYMLTDEICGIYNAQAWYFTNKRDLLDNPPEDANPLEVRKYIHRKIDPSERKILDKFKDIRTRVCKYLLTEENSKHIDHYILSHPILSKLTDLSKKASE